MISLIKQNYPHDSGCPRERMANVHSKSEARRLEHQLPECACSRSKVIARAEAHENFLQAFTAHKNHPDVTHHTYETARTEMITAYRKLIK